MTRYLFLTSFVLTIGCASTTPAPAATEPTGPKETESSRMECQAGEQQVASSSSCLQDDAVCYQLRDGRWCTGPSGSHGNW